MTDTIPLSAIRPIAVEAIREVTGCPDVLGAGGKSLVEAMESVAQAASKVLCSQPDEARDAARYRQLRRKVCIIGAYGGDAKFHILNLDPVADWKSASASTVLDAAIDAAMSKEQP